MIKHDVLKVVQSFERYLLENGADSAFDYYRRPGIITAPGGSLIAYYEGQCFHPVKHQSLFCRVSCDGGKSWSERITLASGGDTGMLHNVMMVSDGSVIHCLWNVQYRQLWHTQSTDGVHWQAPTDLTRALWRADCEYPWNAFGIGSGHGIVLKSGRILIPTWFTTGGDGHKPSGFGNIYSDDGFRSVRIGAILQQDAEHSTIVNPNEGAIVELADGQVLATVRHDCEQRMRAVSYSSGGTGPWSCPEYRPDLPDPICHASLQRLGPAEELGFDGILFSNCANADEGIAEKKARGLCKYNWSDDARKNLTVRFSRDGGRHFSAGILIDEKGGYSDLAVTQNDVVCIYETGWQAELETCIFPRQLAVARIAKCLLR